MSTKTPETEAAETPEWHFATNMDVELYRLDDTNEPVVALTLLLQDGTRAAALMGEADSATIIRQMQEVRWQVCALEAQAEEDTIDLSSL